MRRQHGAGRAPTPVGSGSTAVTTSLCPRGPATLPAVSDLTDHAAATRVLGPPERLVPRAERRLDCQGRAWGLPQIPEDELDVLGDVPARTCSARLRRRRVARLARRGARVTGLDNWRHGLRTPGAPSTRKLAVRLLDASAEYPLADGSFDVVMADRGTPTFADPYLFPPEVAGVMRSGGLFAFSGATALPGSGGTSRRAAGTAGCTATTSVCTVERPGRSRGFNLPTGEWTALPRRRLEMRI